MRITKELVYRIARQLCTPKSETIDLKIKEFSNEVYVYALDRLPKELKELYNDKTIKPYIQTTTSLYLVDCNKNGLRNVCFVQLLDKLPTTDGYSRNCNFTFDEKDVIGFVDKARQIELLIKERNDLQAQIEVILASLKTFHQITEQFPEAIPYLPQQNASVALSVPIDSVRSKLKSE